MIRGTPPELLPAEDMVAFFGQEPQRYIMENYWPQLGQDAWHQMPASSDTGWLHEFNILAPNEERAQELARAFCQLYFQGVYLPLRRQALAEKQQADEALSRVTASLEELVRQEQELIAARAHSEEQLGKEALPELKIKRSVLAIELAGMEARLSAAEKLLGKGSKTTREHLEEIKIDAEIDLAELLAQRSALDQMIEQAIENSRSHASLTEDLGNTQLQIAELRGQFPNLQQASNYYSERWNAFGTAEPFEPKVVIKAIEWQVGVQETQPPRGSP